MKTTKIVAGLLVGLLLVAGSLPVQAATKKKVIKPQQPIEIVADEMYFSDKTGELFAKGNVVITHDRNKIMAGIMRGNDKQMEVWVDGKAQLIDPVTNVTGTKIRYNYGAQFGTMQDIKGKCGNDYITGENIHFEQGQYTAYQASSTSCPAKGTPDYRITARKIVIWPGDKMIAYDAKVWIKNFVIYSTPRYSRSLREDDTEYPSIGYDDPDGFWIKQRLNYALTNKITAHVDLTYYDRAGFRPEFGFTDQEDDYTIRLIEGRFKDSDSRWIRKEPELRFEWKTKPVGKLPWKYYFTAAYGKWTDETKSSWHQDYILYFKRNPIYLDKEKTWTWNNGFGGELIRDSYDASSQNIWRFNTSLSKSLTPWLRVWSGYNFTSNNDGVFSYNNTNVTNEWVNGFFVQLDKQTGFSYSNSYDTKLGRTYENYFTLYRDLHCWNTSLQYQSKAKKWVWNLSIIRF